MKRTANKWWVAGIGAALAPLVVAGCQPSVKVASEAISTDPLGTVQTAAMVASQDPGRAIPSDRPTIRVGEKDNGTDLWEARCAGCHGHTGKADGPQAAAAAKYGRMPDLSAFNYTRDRTPLSTYIAISGSQEPHPFGDRTKPDTYLNDQQRWNATYYVWSLHSTDDELKRGGATFGVNCSVCHGTRGRGDGFLHIPLNPQPRNFTDFAWMMDKPDNRLFRSIKQGRKWTAMPAWGQLPTRKDGLTDQQIYEIVDYLRTYTYTTQREIIVDTSKE